MENESVVAEILRRSNGSVELVDMSEKLEGLQWRPGMVNWKVQSAGEEGFSWFESYDNVTDFVSF